MRGVALRASFLTLDFKLADQGLPVPPVSAVPGAMGIFHLSASGLEWYIKRTVSLPIHAG